MLRKMRKAQSTLEYAALIAVVVGALVAMQVYLKRGIEGKMRSNADDIGTQFDVESGGYHQKSELQGTRSEISVSGVAQASDFGVSGAVAAPGEAGVAQKYTKNAYQVRTGNVSTTDGSADLGW
jgi:hypothetical protein